MFQSTQKDGPGLAPRDAYAKRADDRKAELERFNEATQSLHDQIGKWLEAYINVGGATIQCEEPPSAAWHAMGPSVECYMEPLDSKLKEALELCRVELLHWDATKNMSRTEKGLYFLNLAALEKTKAGVSSGDTKDDEDDDDDDDDDDDEFTRWRKEAEHKPDFTIADVD